MELVTGAVASGDGGLVQYVALVALLELGMVLFLVSVNEHRRRQLGELRLDSSRRSPLSVERQLKQP